MSSTTQTDAAAALMEIEGLLKTSKVDLPVKMRISSALKALKAFVYNQPVAVNQTAAVDNGTAMAELDAPKNPEFFSTTERQTAQEKSATLNVAYTNWQRLREILTSNIQSPDRTIVTVNAPARPNEVLINSFDRREATVMLVASTSTDAYVLTKDRQGLCTLTAAKFWKSVNSVNANPRT